jgi:hypothetical protein
MFYGYERLKGKRHKPEVKFGLWPSLLRRGAWRSGGGGEEFVVGVVWGISGNTEVKTKNHSTQKSVAVKKITEKSHINLKPSAGNIEILKMRDAREKICFTGEDYYGVEIN